MTQKKFNWRERGNSFDFAFQGLKALFRTEHNAWIHGGLTVAAVLLSLLLQISKIEFLILLLAMTFVWVTEIINTAIEKTMDFISTEKHPQIKLVKDLYTGNHAKLNDPNIFYRVFQGPKKLMANFGTIHQGN